MGHRTSSLVQVADAIVTFVQGVYHEQVHINLYAFKVTPPILTLWLEIESLSRYQSVPPVAVVKMRQVPPSGFEMYNVNAINSSGTGTDTQALALTAEGQKLVYKFCLFSSYQDTILIKALPAYFYGCRVKGAVDFIFGSGTAWFDTSNIVVEAPKRYATVTAHQRTPGGNTIFVFNKCEVLPFNAQTPPNLVYLDRPWSPYAAVTFQSSFLSNIVNPLGWIPWSGGPVTGNEHATYQEFGNYGPGSPT
ncbi:hypothetical protein KEM48_004638 [Puccinia striiformis f. sp. tritici PST-130]|nr:hypothetical protein KEM48_004638 [Puccinia striiformis f. sp. tritici PST-130]